MNDDPKDSPIIHHVLYTNDVIRVLAVFVQGLFTIARPERVKAALESLLVDWDKRVEASRMMAETMARSRGEPSGWREPDKEN